MKRRWFFRVLAVIGPILILLVLIEGGLRLAGAGHPSAFWRLGQVEGKSLAVDNPFFTWSVFGSRRARLATPFALDRPKAEGVTRIFVLGGSAAQGDPDPSFSTARFLEVLLPEAWPGARFEVVNAAMTAIDSTVVREVASDVLALEPDLLVLYAGNNEIVGPFGPTAGGRGRRMFAAVRRGLLRLRLGQAVFHVSEEIALRRGTMKDWQGMESFLGLEVEASDEVLVQVRSRFAGNLQAVVDMAQEAGVPVVLCTVGVNLADCPPFGFGGGPNLTEADRQARARLIDGAMRAAGKNEFDGSLEVLGKAGQIDDSSADLEFLRGKVLLAAGRQDEALKAFTRSRDLDRLRFRADSSINRMIRDTAERADPSIVVLADIEKAMEAAALDGVPGGSFFYEHVHLTFEGTSVVAREIIRALAKGMPSAPFGDQPAQVLPDDIVIAQRLALTEWANLRLGSEILDRMKRPPFTHQLGNEAMVREIEKDLGQLELIVGPDGPARSEATLSLAVERDPADWFHAFNLALLLRTVGSEEAAVRYLRRVLGMRPTFSMARQELGRALLGTGRPMAAVTVFRRVVEVHPYSVEALTDFGVALVAANQGAEAVRPLERALKLEPENVSALYHLALASASEDEAGRRKAIEYLRRVVSLDPSHRDAPAVLNALEGSGQQ